MDVYKHEGHTVYRFARRFLLFKMHRKTVFWHKGKLVKNHRFIIKPHKQ